jgi:hypothetical protein
MWFGAMGEYTARQIGYAWSLDGINWNMHPFPVIEGGITGDWDKHKGPGTVIRINDTLRMWYYGMPSGLENSAVGYAWSMDGLNWNLHSDPVLEKGSPGSWDDYGVGYVPKVRYDDSVYHLWYGAIVQTWPFEKFEIGYASSYDGINWIKDSINNPVIQRGSFGTFYDERVFPCIPIHYEDQLHMLFSGSDGDSLMFRYTRIGYAFSDDGVNWTIHEDTAMDVGETGSWESDRIYISSIVYHAGRYKAWYCGVGVDNFPQIGYAESDPVYQCVPDGITFSSQSDIDEFPSTYYYCTEIVGDVVIRGSDINNINGLSQITSIGGSLSIYGNDILTNLAGLGNLTSIGGSLKIGDSTALGTFGNPALTNLMDLNEELFIDSNLFIANNINLSQCHATAICDYLSNPPGSIDIHGNAVGCNNQQQVQDSCIGVHIDEISHFNIISIFPNPCSGAVHLRYQIKDKGYQIFDLYHISGSLIKKLLNEEKMPGVYEMEMDVSDLQAGVYFVRIQSAENTTVRKLIVSH